MVKPELPTDTLALIEPVSFVPILLGAKIEVRAGIASNKKTDSFKTVGFF